MEFEHADAELETRIFRALTDPSRRQILDRLILGDASVNELADGFTTSRPAISQHLRVLREATLVVERRDGRRRIYSLHPEPLALADAWLSKYRAFWAARLQAIKTMLEEEQAAPTPADEEETP
jgi:DNA-binding transcriptional ArsR family regulator